MNWLFSPPPNPTLIEDMHIPECKYKDCIITPVKFTYDGSNIRAVTRCCKGVIRVTGPKAIPSTAQSKHDLWSYVQSLNKGLDYIAELKNELNMPAKFPSTLEMDIAYHNLLSHAVFKNDVVFIEIEL